MNKTHKDLSFAHQLAEAADSVTLRMFRTHLNSKSKQSGYFDPVTKADRQAEHVMRALIKERFPHDGIYGEEFGVVNPQALRKWLLDPIDGTRSFIAGIPLWTSLIGLYEDEKAFLGLVSQPFIQERFWGHADGDALYQKGTNDPQCLRSRSEVTLEEATLFTTDPLYFIQTPERTFFKELSQSVRFSRYSADAYAYCMLASGLVDIVLESGLQPYDIAALIPIIRGAGGCVTTWTGEPPEKGGRILATGNARLHEKILTLFHKQVQ